MATPPKKAAEPVTDAEVSEVVVPLDVVEAPENALPSVAGEQSVSGRAVFAVSRVDVGVAVHTAFLAEDGRLLQMPAVFPNLEYALAQVDEMRQMLINQFSTPVPNTGS